MMGSASIEKVGAGVGQVDGSSSGQRPPPPSPQPISAAAVATRIAGSARIGASVTRLDGRRTFYEPRGIITVTFDGEAMTRRLLIACFPALALAGACSGGGV